MIISEFFSKKSRSALKRVLWVFIPAVLIVALGGAFVDGYTIYRVTRPPRTKLYGSPRDLQIILQKPMWTDEKWKNSDGTQSVGWFLSRGKTSPAVILSHSYGSNRSELLSLSFELWKAGYHVLVYDLRGHGESSVNWSGLGTYETDDLLSAMKYMERMKTDAGQPLVDGRIGLYGVEIGGYSSLLAAAQSPLVKAVAVDSIYPDVAHYMNYRIKSVIGSDTWADRLIDSPVSTEMLGLGTEIYLLRRQDTASAADMVGIRAGRRLLFIVGKDSGPLGPMTRDLYNKAIDQKQLAEVEKTRLSRLYEKDSSDYDALVVKYFRDAIPTTPQSVPEPASKAHSSR
jgi:pimeloyl-ACP methyl ester carboxylesterase